MTNFGQQWSETATLLRWLITPSLPHPPSPPVSGNTSGEGREGGVLNEGLMREGKRWVSRAAFESARAARMAESSQRVAWEKKKKKQVG